MTQIPTVKTDGTVLDAVVTKEWNTAENDMLPLLGVLRNVTVILVMVLLVFAWIVVTLFFDLASNFWPRGQPYENLMLHRFVYPFPIQAILILMIIGLWRSFISPKNSKKNPYSWLLPFGLYNLVYWLYACWVVLT